MIDFETLSPDAPAIILLCSSLGTDRSAGTARPLGPRSWAKLDEGLRRQSFRGPRDLVGLSADEIDGSLGVGGEEATRYVRLLARGGQLAFELDRLRSRGIWVVTIADDAYPRRLVERLGIDAPPVLFGSGDASGLDRGGIAIVGSREADDAAVEFTERLAAAAARGETSIVSGGARGIDVAAMRSAVAAGGAVVGVLSEGVERRLRQGDTRAAVASGQVVLVSPYQPGAPFSTGAAMGRNKLIYALSDVAVVVSSAAGSGGTWTGALEAINGGWVPVLVRDGKGVPDGNRALVAKGGSSLPADMLVPDTVSVSDLLACVSLRERSVAEASAPYQQQALFDE
jgi:predicted Rossmann fold nucleotide-binding protein DprA/Smf involved in DNA uptake